ncbi:hypothetical protein AB4226_09210 [Vibrio artabrorum]|uniref:hypothetical protein n=1 Tax=Vibrio artabrorum TaxID=446374 RepID=UPI00354D0877
MYDSKELSTYAKNMICPKISTQGLSVQGQNDFDKYRFRHSSSYYKGDSEANTGLLLEHVKEALAKSNSSKKPLLLLSDGKDSMTIALAYSKLGISCKTLTFLRKEDIEMKEYIKSVALSLGHVPYFIAIDEILGSFDPEMFVESCKSMDNPVLDQGYLFFLFGLSQFFKSNGFKPSDFNVVDGLGNDETLGYMPSKDQLMAYKLSSLNLWKLVPDSLSFLRWYLRSPSESHGDLSALSCFFKISNAYNLNEYFKLVSNTNDSVSYVDFRAFSRGNFHDHQCMMGKTKSSCNYFGSDYFFPWVDNKLADYCFNLPLESKFDFPKRVNKIILRRLLKENFHWEQTKRGVDLFVDIDILKFSKDIVSKIVPEEFINKIINKTGVPSSVKKRALLELLNFYGYCLSRGYGYNKISEILE